MEESYTKGSMEFPYAIVPKESPTQGGCSSRNLKVCHAQLSHRLSLDFVRRCHRRRRHHLAPKILFVGIL